MLLVWIVPVIVVLWCNYILEQDCSHLRQVCALESRLGTRQLSEELQKKLCAEIGAKYETVQEERQKFAQDVANEERKMVEDVVKSENEPQYETMHGIGDEVFGNKKGAVDAAQPAEAVPVSEKKPEGAATAKEKAEKEEDRIPMADTNDPRYQTLGGMDNSKIFTEKGGNTQETQQIKAPTVGGMVDTNDPNYQTLVGMDNEKIFQNKCKLLHFFNTSAVKKLMG